jgi:hypothetical protein
MDWLQLFFRSIPNNLAQISKIKHVGKLIPVILSIKNKGLMEDGIKILEYKRSFK